LTRRYWPGDQDDISLEHPLAKAGCFMFVEKPPVFVAPVVAKEQPRVETIVVPEQHPDENPPEPELKKK
jgi:hypothetical protein